MAKYKIADFITEYSPKYDNLKELSEPFIYCGAENPLIEIKITDEYLRKKLARMEEGTTIGQAENFFIANEFNRRIIQHNAMLVHSSAIKYGGKAYLFSAQSGVGKSTHTRLWIEAFGEDKVKIFNDDKPVVRVFDNECIAYGTPFDGGSNIALNDSAPLAAIIFIERAEENSIRRANTREIVNNLYFSTVRYVGRAVADSMLSNFTALMDFADFYILSCNTDISAAYVAHNMLIR